MKTSFPRTGASLAGALLTTAIAAILGSCAYFVDQPKSKALLIGMNTYAPAINQLAYCVADSSAMNTALINSGFETIHLTSTSTTQLYKSDVTNAISAAIAEAPKEGYELFIFYYAGHGDTDGSIVLYDGQEFSPIDLISAIESVPALARIIILDSCFSGNFVTESPTISPYPDDYTGSTIYSFPFSFTLIEKAISASSSSGNVDLIVLSAAGAAETSAESSIVEHGILTAGLLESASKGDYNKDGYVTLTEAYRYAADFIESEWNSIVSTSNMYMPRLSGNATDLVLFN